MDLSVRTSSYSVEDRSWLGSAHGTEATRSITLNLSTFTANTHYPTGYLKSGTLLGRITATGLYGPYNDSATDGRQTAAGILFNSIPMATGGTNPSAPLMEHGVVVEAKLPTNSGVDTAGKTDLAGRIIFR